MKKPIQEMIRDALYIKSLVDSDDVEKLDELDEYCFEYFNLKTGFYCWKVDYHNPDDIMWKIRFENGEWKVVVEHYYE